MDKQEEFPFEQLILALQGNGPLNKELAPILKAVTQHNTYWTYSSVSTLLEIIKDREEEPSMKCRSLEAARTLLETCEYTVLTLVEVYMLPVLVEAGCFRGRKSEELASFYFQQTQGREDSPSLRRLSLAYLQTAIEIIHLAASIKPHRTVENQEIKQPSAFHTALATLATKGVEEPKVCGDRGKELRKVFLERLRGFGEESEGWSEFLLVNLLEEVRSGKKELLEVRAMLGYGEAYLTSAVVNLCEEELLDLTDNLELKRKYLALIHELVRHGDIEAIIMIKNSEFVPMLVAHLSPLPGHLGTSQGENIFPSIKASKTTKRDFYCDFLRCLETWAVAMPEEYDSEDFTLKSLYRLLKEERKFKFPENMHMARYQKEVGENLGRNRERNQRLVEMLEDCQESRQTQTQPLSRVSNILARTTLLPPTQLEQRLDEARRAMKDLLVESKAERAFKTLSTFKENWITYLQALDLEGAEEARIETLIFAGERCVEEIQLLSPLYHSLLKGKLAFPHFQQRVREALDMQNELSLNRSQQNKSKSINLSKSLIASKLAKNRVGKSKVAGGRELLSKMKARSKFADGSQLDLSKIIDRSQMHSRVDKSRDHKEKTPPDISTVKKMDQPPATQQQEDEDAHIIRIEDYQVDNKSRPATNNNNLRLSRDKGSKILIRRGQNSRLEKSQESHGSSQRKSTRSLKRVKESSISIKSPKLATPLPSSKGEEEFLQNRVKINETIELNGNIVKEGAPTEKRTYRKQEASFNQFKDGGHSISSIHSNSVLRAFHHSAEKILDLTDNFELEARQDKKAQVGRQVREERTPPLVGQHYSPQPQPQTPKKSTYKLQTPPQVQSKVKKEASEVKKQLPKEKEKTHSALKTEKPLATLAKREVSPGEQAERVKQEKDREIAALQDKIRQLQRESLAMKTKLAARDNEIRSMRSSSKHGSERGHPQFTTLSRSQGESSSMRGSSLGGGRREASGFEREVEGEFRQYLERIKGSTFRKSLLKLKCLVHKTEEIEIGCLSQRSEKNLECTLYITPHRYNLVDLSIALLHDSHLRAKVQPQQVKSILAKKQQKVHIAIEILSIPFCLPEIEINYKSDSEYSSNYNRLTLPLSFNKFCHIAPLSQPQPQHQHRYVRSDNFKYNPKIIKLDKIAESFPSFTVIPPNKDREHVLLTAYCRYLDSAFSLLVNLHEKSCWIEGFLKEGDIRAMNFLICTFKHILDASKK